ncbi:hypothetical protein [Legionella sp. km772]|uniref:hypothetical protein n=1 Tax=Legionella sp. km772 TaxID=2498111 RepID=UPI000F8E2E22|nr:hypothetical protein [Legionella sp. km772]RUR08971.1 hypothetical protein ELY15_09905 [Legionella sp. km772]
MFIQFLFTPINLLFLINTFLFIYIAPFCWRSFLQLDCVAESLLEAALTTELASSTLIFLPLLFIPLTFFYFFSLHQLDGQFFFPITGSLFIKANLLFTISTAIILFIAKKIDPKKLKRNTRIALSFVLYLIVLYFVFLIIIAATTVICLNAFPDGIISQSNTMNYKLIFAVYLGHLLLARSGDLEQNSGKIRAIPGLLVHSPYSQNGLSTSP